MSDAREPIGPRVADTFTGILADMEPGLSLEPPPTFEQPTHALRTTFDRELADIKASVLDMGLKVEAQIRAANRAIATRDADLCLEVMRGDAAVNDLQRKVTGMVASSIATQAPVAGDLRFLLTLDHVAYELERMGDHAASVAKQAKQLAVEPVDSQVADLQELGTRAADLVADIIRALVDVDQARARQVAAADDDIDARYHRLFAAVLAQMRLDGARVDRGARVLFAAHYLERIGDRVTNIAEDIVFLASGEVEDLNP